MARLLLLLVIPKWSARLGGVHHFPPVAEARLYDRELVRVFPRKVRRFSDVLFQITAAASFTGLDPFPIADARRHVPPALPEHLAAWRRCFPAERRQDIEPIERHTIRRLCAG